MHGVLDDDMSVVNDKGMYSWYNIDRVYDFMLSLNVRPVVELSFMPKYLANCSDCPSKDGNPRQCFYAFGDPGSYKGLTQPPQDFADWYDLIHALATHLTERHGLAEVSQWHFEVHLRLLIA
jgi:xylan 1,4-beta-xylosidase